MKLASLLFGVVVALVHATTVAAQGAPALRVRTTCPGDTPVGPGDTRAISVDFAGNGQQVGAIGLTVGFDPSAVTTAPDPNHVVAGQSVVSIGADLAVDPQSSAGTLRILVLPPFRVPIPAIPDGEVVRITFGVAPGARAGCAAVALQDVSSSDTLAGRRVPGTSMDGAIAICAACPQCDDGNACNGVEVCDCTTGSCRPGTPLTGFASVTCVFQNCEPQPDARCEVTLCPGETVPSAIGQLADQAQSLIKQAAQSNGPKRAKKLLKKAAGKLQRAAKLSDKAAKRKKVKISRQCAATLHALYLDAKDRAGALIKML